MQVHVGKGVYPEIKNRFMVFRIARGMFNITQSFVEAKWRVLSMDFYKVDEAEITIRKDYYISKMDRPKIDPLIVQSGKKPAKPGEQ